MPPKGKDPKAKTIWKMGTQSKDIIPPSCKNPPREARSYKFPDNVQPPQKVSEFEPFPDPEEWPGDEVVKGVDFGENSQQLFSDQFEWPFDFTKQGPQVISWRRPKDCLRQPYQIEDMGEAPRLLESELNRGQFSTMFLAEDSYSTHIENSEKIAFMTKQIEQQLTICESFERDETPEECERRKKEQVERIQQQQAKDKKKPQKKQEEHIEEGPIKIRDVRLSNVNVSSTLPPDSKWVGSQLQMIKDRDLRDINSGRPLWSKIYPQKDGAPIYNPSGKYWVKLYYMGKERKVEIDDRIPCFIKQLLLPQSSVFNQLWPLLVSKAVFKLLQFQRRSRPQLTLTGEGFVVYSLIGLVCETIPLNKMNGNDWQLVNEMLNEIHYNKKDVVISAYTSAYHKPEAASNTEKKKSKEYINEVVKNADKQNDNFEPDEFMPKEFKKQLTEQSPSPLKLKQQQIAFDKNDTIEEADFAHVKPIDFSLAKFKRRRSEQDLQVPDPEDTKLLSGFTYSIMEQFQNDNFNMVYVQKRSDRETRLRIEFYEICKANIHKMSKEEKLEHRKRKKEIRERLNEEDKRRIELITKPAIQHRLIRVKTSCSGSDLPSVFCPFSAEEVYIAKKCIHNKLSKPPNYDVPEIKGDDKSQVSQQMKNQNIDETFQVKPLDDFTSIQNVQEPFRREGGGFWLLEKDFIQLFEYLQICYDPKKYEYNQIISIPSNNDNEVATYDNMEILIVQKNPEQEENSIVPLLVGFQPKYAQNIDFEDGTRPFTVLQRFDFESFESILDNKVLNGYCSGQMLQLENKNNVFRIQTFSPLSYTLFLSSKNTCKTCSIFDYLTEYEGYQPKNFIIDYPAIPQKKYFLFFRFRIIVAESPKEISSFVFRLKSTTDNNMLRSMRMKLCEFPEQTDNTFMLNTIEGVHKNLYETTYIVQGTQRIQVRRKVTYYLILEGITPYNIQEGALEIDFLFNNDVKINIDQLESVEPTKYIDKYIPTKYAIIFREKLFVNDLTLASFFVRLADVQKVEVQQQDKKAPPKAKGLDQVEVIDSPLKQQRLIKLELFLNDKLLIYNYGFNVATISNVSLKSTKDDSQVYIIQASFDLAEWPEAKEVSHDTELINWFLTLFSTESVALVRDTTKEDREKAIKKSWEDKEQGRAERAKKSRQKFNIQQKQLLGQMITEEELALINAPRVSKKQREEEAKQLTEKKGGKTVKKEEKKVAKGGKKEEVVEQVQLVQREFPKSHQHINDDIVKFITHLEQDRLSEEYAAHAGLINVRTPQQKREILEAVMMAREETTGILQRNMQLREELKLYQKYYKYFSLQNIIRDQRDSFLNEYQTWRSQWKEGWEQFIQQREQLRSQSTIKLKKEREIADVKEKKLLFNQICRQEKPNVLAEDFDKLLQEAQNTIPTINKDLIKVDILTFNFKKAAQKVLKNIRIQNLADKLSTAVQNFDLDVLKSCFDTLEQFSVEGVDVELIEKAEEMLEEARTNPNWVAEKQAELKKQGKKGKK